MTDAKPTPNDRQIRSSLSPAAQAVYDAYDKWADDPYYYERSGLVAALRAVAEQVLVAQWEGRIEPDTAHSLGINWTRDALHAIAAELESSDA
jgi:hypothetical protein